MNWISVKDKLPEDPSRVLVFKPDVALMCMGVCCYSGGKFLFDASVLPDNNNYWEKICDKPIKGVTHWLPIPDPNHIFKEEE